MLLISPSPDTRCKWIPLVNLVTVLIVTVYLSPKVYRSGSRRQPGTYLHRLVSSFLPILGRTRGKRFERGTVPWRIESYSRLPVRYDRFISVSSLPTIRNCECSRTNLVTTRMECRWNLGDLRLSVLTRVSKRVQEITRDYYEVPNPAKIFVPRKNMS